MILWEIILKNLNLNLFEVTISQNSFFIVGLITLRCGFVFLIAKSLSISWFPVRRKWLTRELP